MALGSRCCSGAGGSATKQESTVLCRFFFSLEEEKLNKPVQCEKARKGMWGREARLWLGMTGKWLRSGRLWTGEIPELAQSRSL